MLIIRNIQANQVISREEGEVGGVDLGVHYQLPVVVNQKGVASRTQLLG